ncbi:MAG: aldehyde dehydrogenase family protein [Woeseiaceae bacterium]
MATKKNERLGVNKTYKLYIGGKFPRTESGRFIAFENTKNEVVANVCRASRKDARNAVVAARAAWSGWASTSGYLRGQILYRIAEMLEGRQAQFISELRSEGLSPAAAKRNVIGAIDRLIYYAGWSDKFTQVQSSVNPVASSHFNFSVPESMGVVVVTAPVESGLMGLVSVLAPVIVGGNTAIALASEQHPLSSMSFAEVLHSSDVPAGVVNVLTGQLEEMLPPLASHMDVNALALAAGSNQTREAAAVLAAENLKRVVDLSSSDFSKVNAQGVYHIGAFQETKTTWHPVAN